MTMSWNTLLTRVPVRKLLDNELGSRTYRSQNAWLRGHCGRRHQSGRQSQQLASPSSSGLRRRRFVMYHNHLTILADDDTVRSGLEMQTQYVKRRLYTLVPRAADADGLNVNSIIISKPEAMGRIDPPHYRTHRHHIFKEEGTVLHEVLDLRVALEACKEYINGLKLLREAHYVHRDITGGNCLVYSSSEGVQSKILDVEHCATYEIVGVHEGLRGAIQFTAVEAGFRDFIFSPAKANCLAHLDRLADRFAKGGDYEDSESEDGNLDNEYALPTKRFKQHFHFLHDLESSFWVVNYYIATSIPEDAKSRPSKTTTRAWHDKRMATYFANTSESILWRSFLLGSDGTIGRLLEGHPYWRRNFIQRTIRHMDTFAIALIKAYMALFDEPQIQIGVNPSDIRWPAHIFTLELYDEFLVCLDRLLQMLPAKVPVQPVWAVLSQLESWAIV
ncbi:hypothetical protein DFP72DRAFT_480858 [Ephemerocybe angulata]|uniref:Fungal-type protein kinase domain-containing protein n=1 Tax=Ephemerocybe angulata TaxID=980116 RepID=A0A8H6IDV6_9AGAR|nr:hypothetical protein DFP72DRAFT_480858 [Tulosesus angulatus]